MQTKLDKVSNTLAYFKVDISEEDYKSQVDKKIKEYAKVAVVKGFRPGHVPINYVKSIYGKSILVDEVIKVASGAVSHTIEDNKLRVVGEPVPKEGAYAIDWEKSKDFSFEYEIGFASDFTVDLSQLPPIQQLEIQPDDTHVESAIEDLRKKYGVENEPETIAEGDLVFGDLKQEVSAYFFQSGIPVEKLLDSAQILFLGKVNGDVLRFDIQFLFPTTKELGFATGKSDEEAADLSGEFEFIITKIVRNEPSELNQVFFDKVLGLGKASDEASFRAELIELMKTNYKKETDFLLDFEIEKTLDQNIKIELPDEFLKKWLLEINPKATQDDIEKEYDLAARGIRLDFIKSEIAKQNEIKVEHQDVLNQVKAEIFRYFGGQRFDGMEDFVETMAKKELEKKNQEENRKYIEKAFGRKVLDFLKTKIVIENKEVSTEEFNEIATELYKA